LGQNILWFKVRMVKFILGDLIFMISWELEKDNKKFKSKN
jgi:hypothetical protein